MNNKQKRIKVLTFGHLPISVGGKQHSGLSIGIWNIANTINILSNEIDYFVAATDIHEIEKHIDKTNVLGWNNRLLIEEIYKNLFSSLMLFFQSVHLFLKFRLPVFNTFAKLLFFNRSIKKVNPDIIHFQGITSFILCSKIKSSRYIKKMITLHGITGNDPNIENYQNLKKMEEIVTIFPFLHIIFISKHVQKQWKVLYGKPVAQNISIYPGINLSAFNYSSDFQKKTNTTTNRIILCTIGSLGERKGQRRVIQALGNYHLNDKFHYICIGAGTKSYIGELTHEAERLKVNIEFTGNITQEEIKNYLYNSHYMILPSSTEGFGAVYLESIACGTPVIIPKTLPLANEPNVLNNKNAVFIQDHSVEAIRECLIDLGNFPYSRKDVATSVDFNIFTWEYGCKTYTEIINSI